MASDKAPSMDEELESVKNEYFIIKSFFRLLSQRVGERVFKPGRGSVLDRSVLFCVYLQLSLISGMSISRKH